MSWRCSHGYLYSDLEMEMGMTFAAMEALQREEEEQYNLEHDQRQEEKLARQHVLGELDCPWPWYADAPFEVQEREIIQT